MNVYNNLVQRGSERFLALTNFLKSDQMTHVQFVCWSETSSVFPHNRMKVYPLHITVLLTCKE